MPTRGYWKSPLSWACNSGMFVFGVGFALLGALLPVLLTRLDLSLERAGLLFVAFNGGGFVVTLAGGLTLDRRGYRFFLAAASGLAAVGLWGLSTAAGLGGLLLGSLLLGAGSAGLNLGTNALTSTLYPQHPTAALNKLGLFFGAGTLLTPLAVGLLLQTVGLAALLRGGAALAVVPLLVFTFQRIPRPEAPRLDARRLLRRLGRPRLLLVGLALFFQSGNEMTIGGWLAAYLVGAFAVGAESAALLLALFWTALVAGRLAAGRLLLSVEPGRLVLIAALMSWGLVGVLSLVDGGLVAAAALAIAIGFTMAPLFPTLLGQASAAVPEVSGAALAFALLPTTVGAMFFPWLAGELAASWGVAAVWWVPLVCFLLVAGLQRGASGIRSPKR